MWFLAGLALYFWPWVLGAAVVIATVWLVRWMLGVGREELERRHLRRAAIAARADKQHAWALAGDVRGVYGDYPPS